ncbi:hypothetical protein CMO92_03110 [Candidatus Woesearchaeota archaeon]|nr:hypothetical protein [Candidatus Woesearchaeota archaeon]|tara:strand:+ start:310 stop:765 length:456 start_codon:yes stop_codon:yes gene_type:complete
MEVYAARDQKVEAPVSPYKQVPRDIEKNAFDYCFDERTKSEIRGRGELTSLHEDSGIIDDVLEKFSSRCGDAVSSPDRATLEEYLQKIKPWAMEARCELICLPVTKEVETGLTKIKYLIEGYAKLARYAWRLQRLDSRTIEELERLANETE